MSTQIKYEIGDKVWVKPIDFSDLKGVVIGHQKVKPYNPIVECKINGKPINNAFDLDRINPRKDGKVKPVYIRIL